MVEFVRSMVVQVVLNVQHVMIMYLKMNQFKHRNSFYGAHTCLARAIIF